MEEREEEKEGMRKGGKVDGMYRASTLSRLLPHSTTLSLTLGLILQHLQ